MNKNDYVAKFFDAAVSACAGSPVFPVLALAESAVESKWGESDLTIQANNLFGIKAYPQYWKGETAIFHTKEYRADGTPYYIDAAFKKYPSFADSFKDYVDFVQGKRYQATGTENAATPEEQIKDIASAGYSTSSSYAQLISEIIEELKPLLPADTSYPDPANPLFNPENFA